MRYLKENHNYISLKMKYKNQLEKEFPALGKKKLEDDGFSHMTEELETEEHELETSGKTNDDNILKVNPNDFEYDEENDVMKRKDQAAFDSMLDKHPSVNKLKRDNKRDQKIENLKEKVLITLKVSERKNRDLSCESVRSGCSGWGDRDRSTDSRGEVRPRSDDEENEHQNLPKKERRSKPLLNPSKIVITK